MSQNHSKESKQRFGELEFKYFGGSDVANKLLDSFCPWVWQLANLNAVCWCWSIRTKFDSFFSCYVLLSPVDLFKWCKLCTNSLLPCYHIWFCTQASVNRLSDQYLTLSFIFFSILWTCWGNLPWFLLPWNVSWNS